LIPYKDDNPTTTFPFVTIGIITINVAVFLWEIFSPAGSKNIVFAYGAVPFSLVTFESHQPIHPALTVFTSMFMHGGFFHLGGNMLYLWIFGNNIEDRLGHLRFVFFYLLGGIFAAYTHAVTQPDSLVPMIGASGAISGVLGAYLLLYPYAKVYTIFFFGFFYQILKVPALIVIGFWAIIQFINGIISKGVLDSGGVAWFAHIGGFLFGILLVKLIMPGRRPKR
jgi:membrane associated rhomboid family serine protease